MQESESKIHTLTEAAEHLRLTNRAVAKIAKRHGLCMVAGRNVLFTDNDIEKIKEVMRWPATTQQMIRSSGHVVGAEVAPVGSASPKMRELALARSKRPFAKKLRGES